MRTRLIRYRSARFAPRMNDYTYPQLRSVRPRISEREERNKGLEREWEAEASPRRWEAVER